MTGRTTPYVYDFDRDVSLTSAIRVIVAALDDDGLALTQSDNSRYGGITSVLLPSGRKRVLVPAHRVVRKGGAPRLEVIK